MFCCIVEMIVNNQFHIGMLFRARFLKRLLLFVFVFIISFYGSVLFFGEFGNLKVPRVMHLTDLSRCPACYGVTVCPELYSNQILLENRRWQSMLFNAKNIYYGYTKSNRRVVLKKLAHDWELKDFDSKLCRRWKLKNGCKPMDLLNVTNIETKIEEIVKYNYTHPGIEPRKGLVFCPYPHGIQDFISPALNKKVSKNYKADLLNIWTMLSINPEPIVLKVIPKSGGWKVPAFGGVCGRLEVVAYEGEPLVHLQNVEWKRKLKIAKQLLEAAMDFTFKHDRFRFYLMDWSSDNIVINENDDVTLVDLEDIIILDKHISPKSDLPNWYKRYARDGTDSANIFSIENICMHHLSDHNIYAVCYILAGDDDAFLYPMPISFREAPHLYSLLNGCLKGNDRFESANLLQRFLGGMIHQAEKSHPV